MALGGFANRVARVDLTNGQVKYEQIPEEWARKYVGARGLGVRYVLENGPTVDPLGPDNILCFMNGPLTGSEANMSGRMAVVTKSPLTGTVTDSHQGGWSAARIEEQLVVTADGCEVITRFPAEELLVTAGGHPTAFGTLPGLRETQSNLNNPTIDAVVASAAIEQA